MNTLHILCSPNKPVHIKNRTDPFSIAIIKFVENMTSLGWNCIAYTIPGSDIPCESVQCLDFISNDTSHNVRNYNQQAAIAISKNKSAKDLVLCFYGWENQEAASANRDLIIVEPGIGYDIKAVFAPYRVFTSYAQMHMYYGYKDMTLTPSWFDAVIPNAFTPEEFEFKETKDDYFLIFGRVIENKGIHIAIQATEKHGSKLVIAGPGNPKELGYQSLPPHVEYVGVCDTDKRRTLMSGARAILGPTYYVEPFGNMIVEGYFSGTPAITSDWGGFVDTVIPGWTGFRCKEFREFVEALEMSQHIEPINCLNWAMDNYSEKSVHKKFDSYFKKLQQADFYRP